MNTPATPTTVDLATWCDFTRGALADGRSLKAELERSAGSRQVVERFGRLLDLARGERMQVPDTARRVAKAVAALRPWSKSPHASSGLRRLSCTTTFDSRRERLSDTRDYQTSHQLLSLEAADFTVHLRLEPETNRHSQVVVGQLLRHRPELRPMSEVPVLVLSDRRVLSRSLTSRFGEFQATNLPLSSLDLCLLVGNDECIDLPLGNLPG